MILDLSCKHFTDILNVFNCVGKTLNGYLPIINHVSVEQKEYKKTKGPSQKLKTENLGRESKTSGYMEAIVRFVTSQRKRRSV